jgi:inosose dehydratase
VINRQAVTGAPPARSRTHHRLALSPACWGIDEAPGWGHQLAAERVLSEAAAVAESAITAGPSGFLPDRSDEAKRLLRRHRLRLVSGNVRAILHHHEIRGNELAHIDGHAHWLSVLGAESLVLSTIRQRAPGEARPEALSQSQWAHLLHLIGSVQHLCARHKLKVAVQPRYGGTIEGPEDIERLLVGSEVGLCLDIGQLVLAGADALEVLELAAGRIRHVHLNDLDLDLARRVRTGKLAYADAVRDGLYTPLGEGGANVGRVIEALRASRYQGWYTLEQPIRLRSADERPLGRISRSIEYLVPLLG